MPIITEEEMEAYYCNHMHDCRAYGFEGFYSGFQEDFKAVAEVLGMPIASGRNRTVFKSECGEWVYKLAHHVSGEIDNAYEAKCWAKGHEEAPECYETEIAGVPVLRMEFVAATSGKDLPDWVDFIDCRQVGYTKDGRLVAYDLGVH